MSERPGALVESDVDLDREVAKYPEARILEVIPKWQCLELLPMVGIGRIATFSQGNPEVFPVNYARLGPDIVFMTGEGTKLHAAVDHERVTFEADFANPLFHTGWSVVVKGRAEEIVDEHLLSRVRRLPLTPWAPGNRHHYVRIIDEEVSGRRIVPVHGAHR